MAISKKDMAARANKAAQGAPSIDDRLRHARELAPSHPAHDTPHPPALQSDAPLLDPNPQSKEGPITPAGARLELVPTDMVDTNPFNARQIYRPKRVSELAASIRANGQEIPGVATKREGRYVLAAGHYRLRALKHLGIKTMALMVHDNLSDKDLYAHSYRENAERESQTSLDNALSWRTLMNEGVYSSETEIAEATGQSLPNVNKTLAALRLSDETLNEVKEDPSAFAMSALYELAMYESKAGPVKGLAMAKLVREGEAGRKEIQQARALIESPKERKRKETSRQYKIQRDGQPIGQLKEWDSGKVTLEVSFDNPKDQAALITELRERFGLV